MSIPVSAFYLYNVISNFKYRHIKSTASKIVDNNFFVLFFVEAISQSGGGWLVYNSANFKAGNFSSVFSGPSLGIIKIGRHGNNSFFYFLSNLRFSVMF